MPDYVIRGSVKDRNGAPMGNVKVQAMDSDQEWFEDRNDDMVGSVWVNPDGTFEIPFDKDQFQEGWLEGNPDIYLIIRNSLGEKINTTEIRRGVEASDTRRLTFDIILGSLEKSAEPPADPYSQTNQRVVTAFAKIGDAVDVGVGDTARTFRLLISAVNAWNLYTREDMWKLIQYDGPQVPRYPWKSKHEHDLRWEHNR